MIDPISQNDATYALAKKLMDVSALRQQAIAANIANSETPGYRRVDVSPDFAAHLKAQLNSGGSISSADQPGPTLVNDNNARTVRPDGNTVDLEHELLAMNKNSVEYGYLTDIVSYNIKQLKTAITGNVT